MHIFKSQILPAGVAVFVESYPMQQEVRVYAQVVGSTPSRGGVQETAD